MKHAPPQPPELGTHDGLAYALFVPDGEPGACVVVLHGSGSAKESHFDFARLCRERGMAAIAFDARGHGASEGMLGAGGADDVRSICELARRYTPAVALRGSSMGGLFAIHAAALDGDVAAVAAICPAPEDIMLRGLRAGQIGADFRMDEAALESWLRESSVYDAAAGLGERTSLLLLHARGDEQVPYTVSEELAAVAHEPKRLILFPGGHHRSLQHDLEVQNLTAAFIESAVRARQGD